MARKKLPDNPNIERHIPETPRPHLELYCPFLKSKGTRDVVTCLYKCPKARLMKCSEFERIYPQLLTFEIDHKYIEKYGAITIPVPLAYRKRRKRRAISTTENE